VRRPTSTALQGLALAAAAAALCGFVQAGTPALVDRDGYFHARYANLLPARGLARSFEWAQESFLRDRFSDEEFLFHVALAPFCRDEASMVGGAKAAVVVLDALIALAFFLVLRAQNMRGAWFFTLLLLAAGNHFLFRLAMARPHLLAILFAVAGAHAILADRRAALAALGFGFAWSYAAPHLLVALALADAVARRLRDGAWRLGPLAASAAGVGAGLVLHPYFPNDMYELYVQVVLVLAQAWGLVPDAGLRLGAEFDPITTRSLLASSPGALLALVFALGAALLGRERPSSRTVSLGFMTGGTLVLFLLSAKFVEYFAPLAVLFAASAATDALSGRRLADVVPGRARRIAAAAGLAVALAALGARAVHEARRGAAATPPPALEGAARWLRAHAPPGETVLHLNWGDFPVLFHFDPTHRYLIGFDPTFMWVRDRTRARQLEDVRFGRRPLDPEDLARTFGGRWLAISKEHPAQLDAALDAGLEPIWEDAGGAVFEIAPEVPPR
jgi:hypothetical protein